MATELHPTGAFALTAKVPVQNGDSIRAKPHEPAEGELWRAACPRPCTILAQHVADELELRVEGQTRVRCAGHRREQRPLVSNICLELLGRHGVFSALVELDPDDALIEAILLEELDLLVDCPIQSLYPREPDAIVTEIE